MGYLPVSFNLDGDESIWIHAVSVGETLTLQADGPVEGVVEHSLDRARHTVRSVEVDEVGNPAARARRDAQRA